MREFDFDLRNGRLRIAGLRLDDREPGPPLAELDRLEVRFRPGMLLRGHLWIEDLALDNPRVRILRTGRGLLNISDLLRPSKPRKQAAAFTLDRLALTRGAIMFEDRTLTPPRAWRADALTIEAAQLSTVNPEPRGRGRLTTTVAGAPLSVEVSEVRRRTRAFRAAGERRHPGRLSRAHHRRLPVRRRRHHRQYPLRRPRVGEGQLLRPLSRRVPEGRAAARALLGDLQQPAALPAADHPGALARHHRARHRARSATRADQSLRAGAGEAGG